MHQAASCGIDIHRSFYQICLVDHDGEVHEKKLNTTKEEETELVQWLAALPACRIVMEACTGAFHLYDLLQDRIQGNIHIVDPRYFRTRFPKSGKKTDKIDALNLAKLASYQDDNGIWIPTEEVRRQRLLANSRASALDLSQQEMNRVHALLREHGIHKSGTSRTLWSKKGLLWLRTTAAGLPKELQMAIELALERLQLLWTQIEKCDKEIARFCAASSDAHLLASVPGVGIIGAFTILTEIGTWQRFENAKQLTSYAGLNPSVSQSGNRCYHGPISKRGNSQLRWICVELGLTTVQNCPTMKAFYERIKRRTKAAGKAKVAVGRKLLTLCWHILRTGRPYDHDREDLTARKIAGFQRKATSGRVRKKYGAKVA